MDLSNLQLADRIASFRNHLRDLEKKYRRKIKLVAVTKKQPLAVLENTFSAGVIDFGENYVQEFLEKKENLSSKINWHFIGRLQSNKAKFIVGEVTLIHTIDSLKLAQKVNDLAAKKSLVQDILLQVNTSGEPSKNGALPSEINLLVTQMKALKNIRLLGLMTMAKKSERSEDSKSSFTQLKNLLEKINQQKLYPKSLTELSMGMSADYEVALECGATIIRVGSLLLGQRTN